MADAATLAQPKTGAALAAELAAEFCRRRPKWQRICDIPNSDALEYTWEQLPAARKAPWKEIFGHSAEAAWRELGDRPCHVDWGFVGDDGGFYRRRLPPPGVNLMMVFMTGGARGLFTWARRRPRC